VKSQTHGAAAASWAGQPERSNLPALRLARWVAVAAGRRVSRLFLHPIAFYFFIASSGPRRHSRAYLERALGRKATWRDVYRHFHTFCATVLDRVYLLREQFDAFVFEASGIEAILEPFGRGEGVLACGAHRNTERVFDGRPAHLLLQHIPIEDRDVTLVDSAWTSQKIGLTEEKRLHGQSTGLLRSVNRLADDCVRTPR
jgi:hypothetical protein